ncbi:MAG: hypothetical protein ACP6IY_03525 [Promethearchaeia archaeon]
MTNPLIVSSAQFKQDKYTERPLDPLNLMVKVGKQALEKLNINDFEKYIDAIYMINIHSWSYEDAPEELAKRLKVSPLEKVYLPDGGDTPQMLVNRAAKKIAQGNLKAVLIIGAEAEYSVRRAKKGFIQLDWPEKKEPKYMEGPLWNGINEFENKYKVKFPPYTYAMFETAFRAHIGHSLEQHRIHMGKLFEYFSVLASKNPYAWSQRKYNFDEITIPSQENRYICHPYTKLMCSNMFVDLAACVIMLGDDLARELKISTNKWVYIMGGADLKNIHELTRRPHLYDSPASREGVKLALKRAGLSLADIDEFDLYSCFPSIVEIMRKEINIPLNDPRPLTITGGLPYFGGPWSNYSMHAIATAVEHIQENPSLKIMVVANGGYNSKQSFGIYGSSPPKIPWTEKDDSKVQEMIYSEILPPAEEKAEGKIIVEAYTITYNREGLPKEGIIIGKLESGKRTIAFLRAKPEILSKLENEELIGKEFKIEYMEDIGLNIIKINELN